MTANPWDKFFWADYENDPPLKLCSFAAQGLWMRMLCICAKSEPKGYLIVAGKALALDDMASLFGKRTEEIEPLLNELRKMAVFSTDRTGKIYNRKMVRNAKKARTARQNGKNGGNPTLLKQTDIPASDNQNPTDDDTYICIDPPTNDPTNAPGSNQKPEARSQKENISPPPGDEAVAVAERVNEAVAIIAAFDESRAQTWGAERKRPWPDQRDKLDADRWLAAGADEGLCRTVFQIGMAKMKADGRDPPSMLRYFDRPVAEAIAAKPLMPAVPGKGFGSGDPDTDFDPEEIERQIAAAKVAERENKPGDVSREIAPRPSEPSLYERITGVRKSEPRTPTGGTEKVAAAPSESTATPATPPRAPETGAVRESTSNEGEKSYKAPDPMDLGPFARARAAE